MEVEEVGEASLTMLAEKTLHYPINLKHLAYCPTMSLLALATDDEQVHVFRTNGQRVFGITRKNPASKVTGIKWKPDGQSLAVAFDHSTCIVSALTGKIMYEKDGPAAVKDLICCLGWATNFTEIANVRETASNLDDSSTLDEFIASVKRTGASQQVPSLPVELAFIDVASTLPKLSVLPMGGSRGDIFNSRVSLDALFKPLSTDSATSIDVLIVGHEDGTIHLSMSEDFSIGAFDLRDADPVLSDSRPLLHCSHPMSTTHALLVSNGLEELHVVPFDLRLICTAGRYLSLLALKVTELHNLLRYLHQVQEHISSEIRTSQDLPSRFMRKIDETLREKSDSKEWLVDELGERGHKRWDKAVNSGYETIRRLTHESLLPALERLCVLLSRLRGLSRFQSSDDLLGLSTLELDNMLDSTNCLQLISYRLLKCVSSESKQFGAFSMWLRHEIEKQATDPASATAQEIAEKDLSFDYAGILAYIQGAMMQSQMLIYSSSPADGQPQWDLDAEGRPLFVLYKRVLSDESKSIRPEKQLPGLKSLLRHLQAQSSSAFDRISEAQRRNVQFGEHISLGTGASSCKDMRMVVEVLTLIRAVFIRVLANQDGKKDSNPTGEMSIYIALGPTRREFRVSSTKRVQYDEIPVPAGAVRDIKFIDDEALALAFTDQKGKYVPRLLKVYYRLKGRFGKTLRYRERGLIHKEDKVDTGSILERTGIDLTNQNDVTFHTMHRFPTGKVWIPQGLEVNGRMGKRTICVVAEDRVHYRQFDIDNRKKAKMEDNVANPPEADLAFKLKVHTPYAQNFSYLLAERMNVNQVLESTLSSDASTRNNAEQQLLQAAEVDFSGYVSTLAHELANEQAQPHIRSAAGIALKNSFSAREYARLRDLQLRWRERVGADVKTSVKGLALQTLASKDSRAGQSAAQFVASIAAIEIPRNEWPELMPALVQNVGEGEDHLKQASLVTIGYICEGEDTELRDSLVQHSNAILTAVVQGARKEETNPDVRYAAIVALSDSLEFVRTNFENEGERNYIMQVICEATQSGDSRIESGAYGCLNRIMALYYDKMRFYMEKALFGLTILGMKNQEEDVAKLAVEFWCTVCEEELAIEDDNALTQAEGGTELRQYFNFARVAAREVIPVLLELLAQQDEDSAEEDYNISRAAYQCLQLFAQAVGGEIVQTVLGFVERNLRHADWHWRDAAVSAFGAIMEGPEEKMLEPLIKQALPVLIQMMDDTAVQVKDSAAYTLGRICENVSDAIDPQTHLAPLVGSLFTGLSSNPKMAGSCCWALMNLADRFAGEPGAHVNPLSAHFPDSVTHILRVTESPEGDAQLRMAAYEVLNAFVTNAAIDSLPIVAKLSDIVLQRLEGTITMQQQIVSVDDRNILEEIQTSLTSALLAIIQRLEGEIKPQSDRIMHVLLRVLNSVGAKSSVPDTVFATVGALANALEEDFSKYMDSFAPFLYKALGNQEEPALCAMAIGLVSDITRSLGEVSQPYCDAFMNYLLHTLRGTSTGNQLRPAILQCFGDMAQAIGPHFEKYLSVVAQVLNQSSTMTLTDGAFEMFDYFISLREGILDAWDGAILAMKQGKVDSLRPYVESILKFLHLVAQDPNRSEALLRAAMGVVGDLADAFPGGDYAEAFRAEWMTQLVREVRSSQEYSARTKETARWAREQIKRQAVGWGNGEKEQAIIMLPYDVVAART
ncbi:MAG: hypothetical protein Q9196_000131 [Gyalolechia fulgens]